MAERGAEVYCLHGVGHPTDGGKHGCDGCCHKKVEQKSPGLAAFDTIREFLKTATPDARVEILSQLCDGYCTTCGCTLNHKFPYCECNG